VRKVENKCEKKGGTERRKNKKQEKNSKPEEKWRKKI
jgi:hypothetical protein